MVFAENIHNGNWTSCRTPSQGVSRASNFKSTERTRVAGGGFEITNTIIPELHHTKTNHQ